MYIAGYGKMTFASDDKYIGYWKDGMRHGKVIKDVRIMFYILPEIFLHLSILINNFTVSPSFSLL